MLCTYQLGRREWKTPWPAPRMFYLALGLPESAQAGHPRPSCRRRLSAWPGDVLGGSRIRPRSALERGSPPAEPLRG